jgi:DeoR/GlpR family transcriptional regulator of sugar metabolism
MALRPLPMDDEHGPPGGLPAPERHARLLGLLRSEGFADIQALKDALGVSVATIRRDLSELEGRGLLRRTHGGALVADQVTRDAAVAVREMANAAEKNRIAEAAAKLVVDGDAVMVDGGTTSLLVARRLAANPSLTFVTNGMDVLAALVDARVPRLHFIGGEYVEANHSFGGAMAAEQVRRFNVDKAILSVSSVDHRRGQICTAAPQSACVQQAMIESARMTIVVADHSKFGRTALAVIAPLDRVDCVVTDMASRDTLGDLDGRFKDKFVFV